MLRIKLNGGALYIAIIISVLISILLSLFIFLAHYNIRSIQAQQEQTQLENSLQSGFEITQSSYFQPSKNGQWQQLPFNNDSVNIIKKAWGCFTLLNIKAKNKHRSIQKIGLFGTSATDTALLVADEGKAIRLAGKISFKGNCYLPKAGIATAYIEGTSFYDLNSLRTNIKQAPNTIPELNPNYLKSINDMQSQSYNYQDSLMSFIPEQWKQSFDRQTLLVKQQSVSLKQKLSGNITIVANDIITVDKNSELKHILLIARKIIFKKGFKGTVHAIAKDSIVIEDECEFNYPSSFCVYNDRVLKSDNQKILGIFFGERCIFSGALLAAANSKRNYKTMIRLNKEMKLIGNVYASDYADIQGDIYGTVICQSIVLQTLSGVYENHLLNTKLDAKKYVSIITIPDWLKKNTASNKVAKWF